MTDIPAISPATDAKGFLPGPFGLRLDEEAMALTALHAPSGQLDALLPFGQMRHDRNMTLLRLWPETLWSCGDVPDGTYTRVDISHGMTRLRLRGIEALHFLADYTTADLFAQDTRKSRCLRTRLGGYDCTLMWFNTRDVQLITDRSLAQSLVDHLRRLAGRHDPANPATYPRPVSPGAPERRG